jgi:hypothetical protein
VDQVANKSYFKTSLPINEGLFSEQFWNRIPYGIDALMKKYFFFLDVGLVKFELKNNNLRHILNH